MDSIPFKRTKILALITGSAMFVTLGYWLASRAPILSYLAIGFFGMTGIFGVYKLLDFGPGIVFDKEGFLDNTSAAAAGRVRWEQVCGIREWSRQGARCVLIEVRDAEEVMGEAGPFARFVMKMNHRVAGSPVMVAASSLDCTHEELLEIFKERWAGWKESVTRASATVAVRRAA